MMRNLTILILTIALMFNHFIDSKYTKPELSEKDIVRGINAFCAGKSFDFCSTKHLYYVMKILKEKTEKNKQDIEQKLKEKLEKFKQDQEKKKVKAWHDFNELFSIRNI